MQKSFEKLAVLDFADEYCENHTFSKGGQVTVKPVRMMIDKNDGSIYCPRCKVEQQDAILFQQANNYYKKIIENGRRIFFLNIVLSKISQLQNQG